MEGAVFPDLDELVPDDVGVDGLSVGGEAHELVFTGVDLEAGEMGEGRVEQAEGVGESVLVEGLDGVALSHADGGGRPLAHAVDGDDRRLLEGGGEEGAGAVGEVVLGELDGPGAVAAGAEGLVDLVGHPALVLEPGGDGLEEGAEAFGRDLGIGGEEAGELGDGLVVEHHQIEIARADLALTQAVGSGVDRDAGVVLLAGEALFLGGGDDLAVAHQAGAAVVVEGADAEDVHGFTASGAAFSPWSPLICASQVLKRSLVLVTDISRYSA